MKARIRRLAINPEAFLHIMQSDTAWRVSQGVPQGTTLRGFTIDPSTQSLNLFLEHKSFELIDVHSEVAPLLVTEFLKIV